MAIITFWNDGRGETGKTVAMAAISTALSIDHNYKILLFNTKKDSETLKNCYWQEKKNVIVKNTQAMDLDTGIEGLAKAILSNKTSPEIIPNYTEPIFKDRLELLTMCKGTDEDYKKNRSLFKEMLIVANKHYDLVFVDLEKNLDDQTTRSILEVSDLIVVCLSQKIKNINEYKELKAREPLFNENNVATLICRYDRYSKYTAKNIGNYIGVKRNIGMVPYSTQYFEACNEGGVADFFIKFRKISQTNPNAYFLETVKETAEMLINKLKEIQMTM